MRDIPGNVSNFLNGPCGPIDVFRKSFCIEYDGDVDGLRELTLDIFSEDISSYYDELKIGVDGVVRNFLLEPLKNAVFYGKQQGVTLDLLLSPVSLVAGYQDGGMYFKRREVKEAWEKRAIFPEKNKVSEEDLGFGLGVPFIYGAADFIHVDNSSGILYLGLSVDGDLFVLPNYQES